VHLYNLSAKIQAKVLSTNNRKIFRKNGLFFPLKADRIRIIFL
jgi:hypothetical protein